MRSKPPSSLPTTLSSTLRILNVRLITANNFLFRMYGVVVNHDFTETRRHVNFLMKPKIRIKLNTAVFHNWPTKRITFFIKYSIA